MSNAIAEACETNSTQYQEVVDRGLREEDCVIIAFDLETSGLKPSADILQIAATDGGSSFSVYLRPTQPIDRRASEVNGLQNINGELFKNSEKLIAVPVLQGLHEFLTFLRNFEKKCLLIAHNASFDVHFLIRDCMKYSLIDDFSRVIYGFSDSLKLFRQIFPERKGKGIHTLPKLAEDLLEIRASNENFHDAKYDVIVLMQLVDCYLPFNRLYETATMFSISVLNFERNIAQE